MSRPNSNSITKATGFMKQLFNKQETITTKQETQPPRTLVLSDRESSHNEKKSAKYHRADTAVGAMNRFILQFSKVEQAYREIETAFLAIVKSDTDNASQDKFKRKCEVKFIRPILDFLGYPEFTDSELKQVFNKDVTSNDQITFKRLLVGSGLCYYEKQPKKKQENFRRKPKNKSENDSKGNSAAVNAIGGVSGASMDSEDGLDDEKMSLMAPSLEEDDVDPAAARRRRFRHIQQGFDVVKQMFDKIDDDASGEITHSEFKQAFMEICRDPDIVDARMAELDYNKDQEITFREFIFGIASWVGFNDSEEHEDDIDNDFDGNGSDTNQLDSNVSSNSKDDTIQDGNSGDKADGNKNNDMASANSNANGNGTSHNSNNSKSNGNSGKLKTLKSVNNDSVTLDDRNKQEAADNKNDEPTETEDASFMNKTDNNVESKVEKTYKVISPKGSDGPSPAIEGKDPSVEKSASISGPPPGYMD